MDDSFRFVALESLGEALAIQDVADDKRTLANVVPVTCREVIVNNTLNTILGKLLAGVAADISSSTRDKNTPRTAHDCDSCISALRKASK